MARRVGVDKEQVLDAALAVLDAEGRPEAVTLSAVAGRVGIRTQSLYAHVDGATGLRRELALAVLADLGSTVTAAAVGRSGRNGVEAILRARLDYALAYPGRFAAAIHPPGDDPELLDAIAAVSHPLAVVLESCGLEPEAQVHWDRISMAAIYGYALMSRDGQLTLPVAPAATAELLIGVLVSQVEADAAVASV